MTVSRRHFCSTLGAIGVSTTMLPSLQGAQSALSEPLRVIAYNVLVCKGWPSDRPLAMKAVQEKQMARRMALELALYDPHIVNFSESPSEAIAKEIAGYLGMNHVRFPSGGSWPGTILSKYEIAESKNVPLSYDRPKDLFTRHWGRAVLKLPNGESLVVHSAHLFPTTDPATRLKEIPAMLESMKEDFASGRSMILMGDLNHTPETEEYKLWIKAGWIDTFVKAGKGNGLTIRADEPKRRIDYIMAAGPISKQIVESRALFEGAFRVNTNDPTSFALSDHIPQYAVFAPM